MFNFSGITHVIENDRKYAAPGFNYSLVGSVPASMLEGRKPTYGDIMGGRVQSDGLAYHGKRWESVADVLEAARTNGVKMCDSPKCDCRKLF